MVSDESLVIRKALAEYREDMFHATLMEAGIEITRHPDDKSWIDFEVTIAYPRPISIDVKGCDDTDSWLIRPASSSWARGPHDSKARWADIYVLTRSKECGPVDMVGWTLGRILKTRWREGVVPCLSYPGWAMPEDELWGIEYLLEAFKSQDFRDHMLPYFLEVGHPRRPVTLGQQMFPW